MSIKLMNLVWQHAADVQGTDLLVMLALADWANDQGACWPSVPALAEKARVSERTVRYIVRRLSARGYLRVEEHRGRNHTNQYLLNLQVLQPENLPRLQVSESENLQVATQNLQSSAVKPAIAIAAEPSIKPPIEPSINFKPPQNEKRTKEKTARRPAQSDAPSEFAVTDALWKWAQANGWRGTRAHLEFTTQNFLDTHRSKGNRFVDWTRAWYTWMRNAISWGQDLPRAAQAKNGNGSRAPAPPPNRPPQPQQPTPRIVIDTSQYGKSGGKS